MKTHIRTILEICFIIAGIFIINILVEQVLDYDYTANWQSLTEWEAEESKGSMLSDKEWYKNDIMNRRKVDRMFFLIFYGLFVSGYFCDKTARNEIKRRGVIIPADGMKQLDYATIISNRRIVMFRFLAIILYVMPTIATTFLILEHPMENTNATGAIVSTNPYFGQNNTLSMGLIPMCIPIVFCIAPYFVFRKITNIISLKYALSIFGVITVVIAISFLLNLSQYAVSIIAISFSGIGAFASFGDKLDLLAKTIGI